MKNRFVLDLCLNIDYTSILIKNLFIMNVQKLTVVIGGFTPSERLQLTNVIGEKAQIISLTQDAKSVLGYMEQQLPPSGVVLWGFNEHFMRFYKERLIKFAETHPDTLIIFALSESEVANMMTMLNEGKVKPGNLKLSAKKEKFLEYISEKIDDQLVIHELLEEKVPVAESA